jgi:soluble lytic murein transglycosylase-like protein
VAVAERDSADHCAGAAWWRTRDYALRARIDTAIRHASLRFAVDAGLIRAVIRHESNYQPEAVSHRGAMGLMQLMPATARELGVVCPFEPRENVLSGTRYLRKLHNRFGSWPRALAAYHAGPRRVAAGRVPAETRRYVRRVVASWRPRLLAWIDLD